MKVSYRAGFLPALWVVFLAGCGTGGPDAPQPGTPGFHWAAAKTAYKGGDYAKASDLLTELSEGKSEFAAKARPWSMVMSAGMAHAYMELSEKYADGANKTKGNSLKFRAHDSDLRAKARTSSVSFIEATRRYLAENKDKEVVFEFEPPQAVFDDPPQYQRISSGTMIPDAEAKELERQGVAREILKAACLALGTGKDAAKARAAYQGDKATVAAPTFRLMLGQELYEVAQILGAKKLNQPHRFIEAAYEAALDALAPLKDDKQGKDWIKKVTEAQKKLKES